MNWKIRLYFLLPFIIQLSQWLWDLLNHVALCHFLFQVVKEAIASGVDGYDAEIKKAVRKAAHGLRLTRDVAMSIASKAVSMHSLWSN